MHSVPHNDGLAGWLAWAGGNIRDMAACRCRRRENVGAECTPASSPPERFQSVITCVISLPGLASRGGRGSVPLFPPCLTPVSGPYVAGVTVWRLPLAVFTSFPSLWSSAEPADTLRSDSFEMAVRLGAVFAYTLFGISWLSWILMLGGVAGMQAKCGGCEWAAVAAHCRCRPAGQPSAAFADQQATARRAAASWPLFQMMKDSEPGRLKAAAAACWLAGRLVLRQLFLLCCRAAGLLPWARCTCRPWARNQH